MQTSKIEIILSQNIRYSISKFLTRYFKIDTRLYECLINQQLWFADPKTFNDPYDCNLNIDTSCSLDEYTQFAISINSYGKNIDHFELQKIIQARYNSGEA